MFGKVRDFLNHSERPRKKFSLHNLCAHLTPDLPGGDWEVQLTSLIKSTILAIFATILKEVIGFTTKICKLAG
jgi:hypothetical protein